jgi:phospholipase C
VPAIVVSPWVAEGAVFNDEHRHTSILATLREQWGLGEPLTGRDASARTIDHVFTLDSPRDPSTWPDLMPLPVPDFQVARVEAGQVLSTLGRHMCHGLVEHEEHLRGKAPPERTELPDNVPEMSPTLALDILHRLGARYFPKLVPKRARPSSGDGLGLSPSGDPSAGR